MTILLYLNLSRREQGIIVNGGLLVEYVIEVVIQMRYKVIEKCKRTFYY